MVAPGPLVRDVHPRLALARGHHERAVHVDRGPLEELRGLPGPDVQAGLVGGLHQTADVRLAEAAAEIAGRGRVGDSLRAQSVEKDLVVATQLDVFQACAVAEGVVGQVEHVIRLVVRAMDLQEVQAAVDGLHEPDFPRQLMHHADAAHADGPHLVSQLHTDVAGCKHRPASILPCPLQSPLDPPLGFPQTILYPALHSKSSLSPGQRSNRTPLRPRKTRKVSSFPVKSTQDVRLLEV
jgi:hypothetical protein